MIVNDQIAGLPRNCLGTVFPTRDGDAMVRLLGIAEGDRVLEVGGGFFPFARADVITDLTFSDASNRNGAQMMFRSDKRYVECPAETLPFEDGEFDFVFCAHVLEHVADPAAAMREMSRVARRGFIEVPRDISDYLSGNPTHRWLIAREDDALVFRRRNFLDCPLENFLHAKIFNEPAFHELVNRDYRNLLNLQVAWEGEIPFRIEEAAPGDTSFDYDDAVQAGESHLLFAYNLHKHGADPKYAVADAHEATRYLPESADAWIVRGLYDARMLLLREAADAFRRALELRPGDATARHDLSIVERALGEGRFDAAELVLPPELVLSEGGGAGGTASGPASESAADDGDPSRGGSQASETGTDGPLVTVVFVAPEDRELFDEAIQTVFAQRYTHREIVIVTPDPVEAEGRIERVKPACPVRMVLCDRADPRGARLNRGFEDAKGDYVSYLAEDSIWTVFHLSRLVDLLEGSQAVAAYSDATRLAYVRDAEGRREVGWQGPAVLSPTLRPDDLASDEPIPVSNLVHRRDTFAGFDPTLEDLQGRDFLLRIARQSPVEHLASITTELRTEVRDLGTPEERERALVEQRRVLENYSHFEPLELMRRLVELYNQNSYLRGQLEERQKS